VLYNYDTLNLFDRRYFRPLEFPVGKLDPERFLNFESRYKQMAEMEPDNIDCNFYVNFHLSTLSMELITPTALS